MIKCLVTSHSEQQEKLQLFSSSKHKLRVILTTYRDDRNLLAEGSSDCVWQRCISKKCHEAEAKQKDLKKATYYLLWREQLEEEHNDSLDTKYILLFSGFSTYFNSN